jgi:PhnB protein
MTAKPIPDGYTSITPYLTVDDGKGAIDFYKRAFGAEQRELMDAPGGKVGHASLQVGNARIMLCDPFPQFSGRPPNEVGATTVTIFLYVPDVDGVVRQAADAGATVLMEPEDQFWGDRMGRVQDPFGHVWLVATHVEELTPEEIAARGRKVAAEMAG